MEWEWIKMIPLLRICANILTRLSLYKCVCLFSWMKWCVSCFKLTGIELVCIIHLFLFSFLKVRPTFTQRTAHAKGSEASCISFSYDNKAFATRGGEYYTYKQFPLPSTLNYPGGVSWYGTLQGAILLSKLLSLRLNICSTNQNSKFLIIIIIIGAYSTIPELIIAQ